MTNPYAGSEPYASAWQHGFNYGQTDPGNPSPPTPDFSEWGYDAEITARLGPAWDEGAAAGRTSDGASTGGGGGVSPGEIGPGEPPVDISQSQVDTVHFWINAFIEPEYVDSPPGAGLFENYYYFSGDSRSYSEDPSASSRIHSEVVIGGLRTATPAIVSQSTVCGASHALDESHNIVDTKTATPHGGFTEQSFEQGRYLVSFQAAASMPLMSASPDADMTGMLEIDVTSGAITWSGMIDGFPWYEAYVVVDGGSTLTLFQEDMPAGNGPSNLVGDANRPVYGTVDGLSG